MVGGMPTERITVKLPAGFDPSRHLKALSKLVSDKYGDGFELDSIDPDAGIAYATRQASITEVATSTATGAKSPSSAPEPHTREVRLAKGTKPADGEKVAAKLADQYPGWAMVKFEPFLGRAMLSTMDDSTQRARDAVAVAVGVKPWDIGIVGRADGGFDVSLPRQYVPSKHDGKLDEVATAIVGADGWYVDVDPQKLTASIIPGEPPTFPAMAPYPFDRPVAPFSHDTDDWAHIPLGVTIGRTGGELGPELVTDFVLAPHCLVSGLTGGGKGVSLSALMSGALAQGWQLAICDAVKGGVDFIGWQKFVRDGGWGDDLTSACAVISLVYKEGARRKAIIKERQVQKWTQLPPEDGIVPLLLVVDELTSLISPENIPKGIPKDNPVALEISERNLQKATILNTIGKIARELRFVGISLVAATQVASTTTGIPTELRSNLGAKLLLGAKPTDRNRGLALNDPDAVPKVPLNVVNDPSGVSRGVGVFEFEGQEPGVAKIYFAAPDDYVSWLNRLGVPTNRFPRPTPSQIASNTPSLDDGEPVSGGNSVGGAKSSGRRVEKIVDPVTGEELHGFDRANEQRRRLNGTSQAAPSVAADR
jgi:hypothetical protein